jgi:ubiquinone/menaquinone biosynthesis C-methylase UbiE
MSDNGQVNASAAEIYEDFFIPALFEEWAPRVADAARIQRGQRVIDVGCGTGVLARLAARRVGRSGSVVGLDVNEGILAVARRKAAAIEWHHGPAEALPFDDGVESAVVSQFGLMFFQDRRAALQEMARVLRPGGHLVQDQEAFSGIDR